MIQTKDDKNTSKFVKKNTSTLLHVVFSILFLVFWKCVETWSFVLHVLGYKPGSEILFDNDNENRARCLT